MNEKDPLQNNPPENQEGAAPEILTNEYDPAVVIDEKDRTVLLTENETLVIEKDPTIDTVPKNRPRKVYGGMWGPAEIGAVSVAALAVLALIVFYLVFVARSNSELEAKRVERDTLEKELVSEKSKYGNITNTREHVARLISSVGDFEVRYLPVASIGQASFYQRLNGLIAAHGLINTSGPNYLPLDVIDPRRPETEEEKGRSKFKSLFPGLYVSMTVEGTYQNLRRFIREIEATEQFVVISTVELEPADSEKKNQQNAQNPDTGGGLNGPGSGNPGFPGAIPQPGPAQPKGKMHGETVGLRVEMAAYFRRPNFSPQVAPETSGQ